MSFFSRYKWHILFWGCYFLFWMSFSTFNYGTPPIIALFLTVAWFIGQSSVCYLCIYRLLPRYFNSRGYLRFAGILLASLLLASAFILGALVLAYRFWNRPLGVSPVAEFFYLLLGNFYSVVLFVGVKLIKDRLKHDKRNQLLEKANTENELRFLKSQMNPHFLFNAINSIYVLIKTDSDLAALTLIKFADMLRYQLYECNGDKIPIEKEISYLDNYIGLERLRRGDTIRAHYDVHQNTCNFVVAPLLIIPFVENAFKYVSTWPDRINSVNVELNYREEYFEMRVENTVDEDTLIPKEKSWGGIGLENVRRRLELIYKDCHSLEVGITGEVYSAVLRIKVK
jgi:two-component system LytT family sensor kinase